MLGLAIVFGGFAAVKLFHHDLYTGLWSFAVCFALVLGLLPPWLTGHRIVDNAEAREVQPVGGVIASRTIARSWRGPLGRWIALLVTGLVPAGR
jgi:hypothetical protein